MATNIVRFDGTDGIEILIDTATGESFASVRGYARMSGKAQSTIQSRIDRMNEGERNALTKTAEIPTAGGLQGVRLVTEDLICQWIVKDNPDVASGLLKLGVRLFNHKIAGYYSDEPKPIALPPADIRVTGLVSALQAAGIDLSNPRIQQPIQDLILDRIIGVSQALPSATEEWLGVAEKAERMGYAVGLVVQHRSQLGRYVSGFNLESRKERRMCNGTMREINLYLDCPEFESAIAEFMDAKVLASAQA